MKVAVFLPNWVGDVVMATPALRALREHFADATILGVMRPYVADVLAGTDLLDASTFDTGRGVTRGVLPLARRLRQEFVDLAVLFTNSYRTALAAWLGRCQRRVGYAREGRGWLLTQRLKPVRGVDGRFLPSPIIDAYNLLAEAVGTARPGYQMVLATRPEDEAHADRVWAKFDHSIHHPVILLNPGAAFGAAKHWPAHHFARLARLLVDRLDAQVLVLCGPKEADLARMIVQLADRCGVYSLDGETPSLGLTKACVRRADLLITTDSGPRHFAAAFDRPVVTLFGPTHVEWTETYFARAVHLRHEVPCGPCQQRVCPVRGAGHHRCMEELLPDEVFDAAVRLLNGRLPLRLAFPVRPERRRAS